MKTKTMGLLLALSAMLQLGGCAAEMADESELDESHAEELAAEDEEPEADQAEQKAVSGKLRIIKQGSGLVIGDDGLSQSINCGNTCEVQYLIGAMITLTATPAAGFTFGGWTGTASCGTAPVCVTYVPPTGLDVTAKFNPPRTLTLKYNTTYNPQGPLSPANASRFKIVRNDTGATLTFTADGKVTVPDATSLTITPINTPTPPGKTGGDVWFAGWNSAGACAGFGGNPCVLTMNGDKAATGVFCAHQCAVHPL